ncbi:MAG: hypothetical protein GXO34_05470 [Deltaproteobacteria bacterium]|nr:hypothetical protein [Deltaproteobacteria bacterium]
MSQIIRKRFFIIAIMFGAALLLNQPGSVEAGKLKHKKTVGATEVIHVVEADLDFVARIDTGARTTSINAQNIRIENPAPVKKENIGKRISLDVINAKGEKRHLETTIVDALQVRNAQGVETRYMIPLTLRWQGISKKIKVNLRNREAMTYKLLIGRDWLSGDFVVDVDINKGGR